MENRNVVFTIPSHANDLLAETSHRPARSYRPVILGMAGVVIRYYRFLLDHPSTRISFFATVILSANQTRCDAFGFLTTQPFDCDGSTLQLGSHRNLAMAIQVMDRTPQADHGARAELCVV